MTILILGTLGWMLSVATGFVLGYSHAYNEMCKTQEAIARLRLEEMSDE